MSIDGIQPATVLEVGQMMAETLGKDWCRDRKEIVTYINKFREYLHLMYPDEKLFTNKFYCMKVECFPEDCTRTCACNDDRYYGVTIPDDIDGILEVWDDHEPLRTYSKWWEGRFGVGTLNRPATHMGAVLVHQQFPTKRPMLKPSPLSFFADNEADNGKTVTLKVRDLFLKKREVTVELRHESMMKTDMVVMSIDSIVLPSNLQGSVTMFDDDGYEISEYCGYETVPSYRRLKIESYHCKTGKILIHGSQKFKPIYYDYDIVEVGSRLIVEAAARMFRYGENGTEADEINRSRLDEDKLNKLLRGALNRKRGQSKQDGNVFNRKRLVTTPRLPGYSLDYHHNSRHNHFSSKLGRRKR